MYAVIETGGKQYRVEEGDRINVEKLDAEVIGINRDSLSTQTKEIRYFEPIPSRALCKDCLTIL